MYKPDCENIQIANFYEDNFLNIPNIKGYKKVPKELNFISFNYCKSLLAKGLNESYSVDYFLDDYQFNRLWRNPKKYVEILKNYDYVLSPDFSLYSDYPVAMQIWKHYQKHWLARFWQENGIKVIPTICWSDESSYLWCFLGEPKHSVVAVSSVGTQKNKRSKELFIKGYNEMLRRLQPTEILFWGNIPDECKGNIRHMGYVMDEKFKLLRS